MTSRQRAGCVCGGGGELAAEGRELERDHGPIIARQCFSLSLEMQFQVGV